MPEPAQARPVFSNEDFTLLRHAVAEAIRTGEDNEMSRKLANLHHRLGRFGKMSVASLEQPATAAVTSIRSRRPQGRFPAYCFRRR